MKGSDLMFALIITVGIMAIMGAFFTNIMLTNNINVPSQYNDTLNIMKDINTTSNLVMEQKQTALKETNSSSKSVNPLSDFLDIVGFWFESGWKTVKIIPKSLDLFSNMVNSGLGSISDILGIAYEPIKFIIIGLITVGIIFFLLAVLVKWDV